LEQREHDTTASCTQLMLEDITHNIKQYRMPKLMISKAEASDSQSDGVMMAEAFLAAAAIRGPWVASFPYHWQPAAQILQIPFCMLVVQIVASAWQLGLLALMPRTFCLQWRMAADISGCGMLGGRFEELAREQGAVEAIREMARSPGIKGLQKMLRVSPETMMVFENTPELMEIFKHWPDIWFKTTSRQLETVLQLHLTISFMMIKPESLLHESQQIAFLSLLFNIATLLPATWCLADFWRKEFLRFFRLDIRWYEKAISCSLWALQGVTMPLLFASVVFRLVMLEVCPSHVYGFTTGCFDG